MDKPLPDEIPDTSFRSSFGAQLYLVSALASDDVAYRAILQAEYPYIGYTAPRDWQYLKPEVFTAAAQRLRRYQLANQRVPGYYQYQGQG